MARYPAELKASVIEKMMPPHNIPVAQLERETGISNVTLYTWRKQVKEQGAPVPGDGKNPELMVRRKSLCRADGNGSTQQR